VSNLKIQIPVIDLIKSGLTFSVEFFPPRTEERKAAFSKHLSQLDELSLDFCSITYGAGGSTTVLTPEYVSELSSRFGIPAIAHLTCVEHSRSSIEDELDLFDERKIRNILALRGDPKPNSSIDEKTDFKFAFDLLKVLRSRGDYCIGVAAHVEGHIDKGENDFDYQAEKLFLADFAITQLFYNESYYEEYVEKMSSRGIDIPIIPGVLPLTNLSRVSKIVELSGATIEPEILKKLGAFPDGSEDQRKAGEELTAKMCRELLERGAPGLHFYTMNRADSVKAIIENLR
jgi:methylenetetrahydrofolate reductase (NADPH)